MKFSDLKGNKAVSTETADTVGKVSGFVLDPAARTLQALVLKKPDGGPFAPWPALTGVGADAVVVPSKDALVEGSELIDPHSGKDKTVLKKRVLSTAGDELGKVKDIDFDPATGALNHLVVDTSEIAASRLRGVGSYAVVVDAE